MCDKCMTKAYLIKDKGARFQSPVFYCPECDKFIFIDPYYDDRMVEITNEKDLEELRKLNDLEFNSKW